ncbi:NAD(P)-binding protein [Thalassobacillus devorans]|uniref:NAD(P)-binding protein n=1 Tax=Thalassobacillus devorans TaxID=279813 RepID=UPI0004B1338A|nr:NAD(P)-binding protein [Thalassobacillus devorans]
MGNDFAEQQEVNFQPLMIDFKGRCVVIIGGGKVAAKRARVLLQGGALITVISPALDTELEKMRKQEKVNWKKKLFEPDDLEGAFMVVVATDDPSVNMSVLQSSSQVPLVNAAGEASGGNVHFPAFLKRGKLTLTVSTHGASPILTSRIKEELENRFEPDFEMYVDFLYECRQLIKNTPLSKQEKRQFLHELLDESFRTEEKQQQIILWLKRLAEGGERYE